MTHFTTQILTLNEVLERVSQSIKSKRKQLTSSKTMIGKGERLLNFFVSLRFKKVMFGVSNVQLCLGSGKEIASHLNFNYILTLK